MNSNAKVLAIAKETIDKDRLKVHPKCYNKLILINRNKKYLDTTSKTPIGDSKLSSAPLPKNFVRQVVQFYVNQVFCASDKQYE